MRPVPARDVIDQNEVIPRRTDGPPGVSEAAGSPDGPSSGAAVPEASTRRREPASTSPERDVRRKRPPLLSFLLRVETLRRLTRVILLLALDFVGVAAALYTAMALKLAVQGTFSFGQAWNDTRPTLAFAYLVTVLMFARVDLYADRPRRPGLAKIASALFLVTVITLVFTLANGDHFTSYYIFYGSLFFGIVYIGTLRALFTRITGRLLERAGLRRRAILVGTRQPYRGGRPCARRRRPAAAARRSGRLHLADPAPGERAALARLARPADRGHRRASGSRR